MKHLLRKLHIGGGVNEHQRLGETRPTSGPSPSTSSASSSSSSSSSLSTSVVSTLASSGGVGAAERSAGVAAAPSSADSSVDFNFFEEEFQVQLALAMSASDPASRDDPESVQIKAAKRISLGCSPSVAAGDETLIEFLSLQYWNYNIINYDEKVVDGFYDIYGISSNPNMQGKMPLLMDLEAISISDNVDYEVILVNRPVDPALQQLERRASSVALECQAEVFGPNLSGLVQKIADLVVDSMGGPVGDADEMLRRWTTRRYELRSSLNTIILPLGCLDVGLSRHRALLFKVLADRINLPCRLVKGSYYTGTDEGAVNLIKIDHGSEYIIDLMGAPGTLIPTEMPFDHLPNYGLDAMSSIIEAVDDSRLALGNINCQFDNKTGAGVLPDIDHGQQFSGSEPIETSSIVIQSKGSDLNLAEKYQTERFEHEFGKLLPSLHRSHEESSSDTGGKASPAQKMKIKDVSKYVISAAKNPEFAQKLHAVLIESGASPPPDLFSDIAPRDLGEPKLSHLVEGNKLGFNIETFDIRNQLSAEEVTEKRKLGTNVNNTGSHLSSLSNCGGFVLVGNGISGMSESVTAAHTCQNQFENALDGGQAQCFQGNAGMISNNLENKGKMFTGERQQSTMFMEAGNRDQHISCNLYSENVNPVLNGAAEWEIPWEHLQIGERIGLGSYGEVYRADWNGTEVAVKKFLDQDFSGDALEQFRFEVRIMLRLRHPNVVLFMGAVTRPPNLSILTEFLPRGSLFRLLHRPSIQLDEKRRMRMALDVAKGMNYLHTSHPTIVHRDLKSPNLLVDKNWVVKVCDFGLSRLKHHTFLSSKSTAGTPEWMAPEVLRNEPSNEKCDVYSFGVILWELATLCMPWTGMNPMQVVGAVGFQHRRLDITAEVDPTVAQIIRDCWDSDPNLRPSFAQLMPRLKNLQRLVVERT